jgi:hypothetical protein
MIIRNLITFGIIVGGFLLIMFAVSHAGELKDRACTAADVKRFEMMFGASPGGYRTDVRFQVTVHYLGTAIGRNGVCNVQLRPVN